MTSPTRKQGEILRQLFPQMRKTHIGVDLIGETEDQIWERAYKADGRCTCKTCGRPYSKHPYIRAIPSLTVLCDREVVKL